MFNSKFITNRYFFKFENIKNLLIIKKIDLIKNFTRTFIFIFETKFNLRNFCFNKIIIYYKKIFIIIIININKHDFIINKN